MPSLTDLLASHAPVLLDGATGTELERRGFSLEAAGWSARAIESAPDLLEQIHRDYVEAGADIITANTFRLHQQNLAGWGRGADQANLVDRAIRIARKASGANALVAGSIAPVGDCYSPDQVPLAEQLEEQHSLLAKCLVEAGVDLLLIETMVDLQEALTAARIARSTGLPWIISFVTGPGGKLLSGETLGHALRVLAPLDPAVVGVNCVSTSHIPDALTFLLAEGQTIPAGLWANTGERSKGGSWRVTTASQPAVYAGHARRWRNHGISLIGGCCGTTPDHIRSTKVLLK